MRFSYFDTDVTKRALKENTQKLAVYQKQIAAVVKNHNDKKPEYALAHASLPELHQALSDIQKQFRGTKHLVVVGIGGSSLGIEAIHTTLGQQKVALSVLDTIAPYEIDILIERCKKYKKASDLAICVISKSGGTAETLANASVLLTALEKKFKKEIYRRTLFIGDAGTDFMKAGKRLGVTCVAMPSRVGGRYSVATEVGLVPMVLLGHDVDSYIQGVCDANADEFTALTAESAVRIHEYIQKDFRSYNFFAFDKRLALVGAWYRQLFAESLGKAQTKSKKALKKGMLPTVSTAVELHSVGQLYLSGFAGVYTDFVTFDDSEHEHQIPKAGIGKAYGRFTNQEVATAIYGGVITAYQEHNLPFRTTIFDDDNLAYSLGLFMAMRMREVMYAAYLLEVNAFDQPNVESYKKQTRKILGL